MVSRPKARRPAARPARAHTAAPKRVARPTPKHSTKKPVHAGSPKPKKAPTPIASKETAAVARPEPTPVRGDARRHVLSLSFLRDGDEFLARLETDSGQITELKNRSLDQLLTLVASELEDLLE